MNVSRTGPHGAQVDAAHGGVRCERKAKSNPQPTTLATAALIGDGHSSVIALIATGAR